jgi:hypothetical protein
MDITTARYDDTDDELEDEAEADEEEETDEDAAISLALGTSDPDRIESFRDAVRLCMKSYGG